jgi:PRTRC genetic system protein B
MELLLNPTDTLTPKVLLVFYHGDVNYVESHIISDKGKILAGRPLSFESAVSLKNYLTSLSVKLTSVKGFVNERIIYCADGTLIWKFPGKKGIAKFDGYDKPDQEKEVRFPKGIFIYKPTAIYLFAYDKYEGPATMLFKYPTPNIMEHGNICWGSVQKPSILTFEDIQVVEDAFFNSKFSHTWPQKRNKNPMGKLKNHL